MPALKQIWSCGGGTQSCAIAVLIIQGRLPRPDLSIIADTGREKKTTWNYYEAFLKPGLAAAGVNLPRVSASEWSYVGTGLYNFKDTLLIPAFTDITEGRMAKLDAFCSSYWKRDVCQRYASSQGIKPSQACVWLGYSIDEPRRYIKKKSSKSYLEGRLRFPLVDDVPLKREEAIDLVLSHGWPTPPRSSCWACPHLQDSEWLELRETSPEEFQAACNLDDELRAKDPNVWLHRSAKPLREVEFKNNPGAPQPCDSGHCFT
jgi:hypothetical protein